MESSADLYNDVVSTYIHVIKQDSPEAAVAIMNIHSIYGARAALHATLVITLLKMEVQKNRSMEDIPIQMHLMKEFPEALPLLEFAVKCFLQIWGIAPLKSLGRASDDGTSAGGEPPSSTFTLPPV